MRCYLMSLLLVASAHAVALAFDGKATHIPAAEWQWLDEHELPEIAAVAQNLDRFLWIPLAGSTALDGSEPRLLRLDIHLSYAGPHYPLLVIPYAFSHELRVGVVHQGEVDFWYSVLSHGESVAQLAGHSYATVVLPLDQPGDYQLLIKATAKESAVITGGARLYLDQDFFLRDHADSLSRPWVIAAVLSALLMIGVAAVFYHFRSAFLQTKHSVQATRAELVNRFSHELRTPLNAVIGLADLMKTSPRQSNVENYANMIQVAGHTLLDLVNDILDFSKLDGKGIPLAQAPLRLDTLFTEVMGGFVPQALETGIIPRGEIEPDLPFFLIGDEVRIKQIFNNLVNNAIKFSPPNAMVIISVKKGTVVGDKVELLCSVRDSGRGIPSEKQQTIFEPYVQADPGDSKYHRGTGLGLAICKLLIEQMGGGISVESEPGKGSVFTFNLWLTINTQSPDLKQVFAPIAGKKILLLSESELFLSYIARVLRYWGAEVDGAASGEQAPQKLFNLVLIDAMYWDGSRNADWIEQQPHDTLIDILEIKANAWVTEIGHPNVQCIVAPIPLLNFLVKMAEHLAGAPIPWDENKNHQLELRNKNHLVLLIDDNAVNLLVGSKLLDSIGVRCETAISGTEGLEKLHRIDQQYSLVLLDCEMPDISGFEVCRQWRAYELSQGLPRMPIVALTAHALNDVRAECLEAGIDEVVFKPIGRNAMIELLNSYPVLGRK